MKDGRSTDYFDTNYMTILRIEQILHNFEDQKIAYSFNLEQVNFCVTLVTFDLIYSISLHREIMNTMLFMPL